MVYDQIVKRYWFYDYEICEWMTPDRKRYWTAGECPEDFANETAARKWVLEQIPRGWIGR